MTRIDNYEQRFGGIGRLYTPEGLARLRQAHVCVIGIGGVGSWGGGSIGSKWRRADHHD